MAPSKRQAWAIGCFVVILGGWQWSRMRLPSPPPEVVGNMEANHPWMVIDPSGDQGLPSPFADKKDSNILYLIFVMRNGSAIKINLREKTSTPCWFKGDDGDPAVSTRYLPVINRMGGAWLNHSVSGKEATPERISIWDEFRGLTEMRRVAHTFGYPFANKRGERIATLQTGYWYVMDGREGKKVELLRVKIKNSEVGGGGGLGDLDLSPNKRWAVFTVANRNPHRVFIFDREAKTPEVFP